MFSTVLRDLCHQHGVKSVRLAEVPGVAQGAAQVCDVAIDFVEGHGVRFKLPADATPLKNGVVGLDSSGDVTLLPGARSSFDEGSIPAFFSDIRSRLEKIRHEQSVQTIRYLGNTFVLNNRTVFDVVADEDGHLTIEMHRGGERHRAALLASSLLDGLYDGSIRLCQNKEAHS